MEFVWKLQYFAATSLPFELATERMLSKIFSLLISSSKVNFILLDRVAYLWDMIDQIYIYWWWKYQICFKIRKRQWSWIFTRQIIIYKIMSWNIGPFSNYIESSADIDLLFKYIIHASAKKRLLRTELTVFHQKQWISLALVIRLQYFDILA